MHDIDALIIGSGPAGVSTALHLLQIDPRWSERMLLIEKAVHPRPKLCGGGVTLLGLDILKELGFSYPLPIPAAEVDDVSLIYRERVIHYYGRPAIVVYHRPQLDAYLADQARRRGVDIHEGEAVLKVMVRGRGVEVLTNKDAYRVKIVVGADGSNGLSRRLVNGRKSKARIARLLETLSPADTCTPHFAGRYATFQFSNVEESLQGYYWEFPSWVDSHPVLNCGIYDARMDPGRSRADLPRLLARQLGNSQGAVPPMQVKGHPIHWFSPRSRFAAPRLLLVGDAAGADPLFGEGIAPALGYGKVAAGAIQDACARRDFSFHNYRRLLFRSRVGRYLLARWWVAWWSYHFSRSPAFMHALWTVGGLAASI